MAEKEGFAPLGYPRYHAGSGKCSQRSHFVSPPVRILFFTYPAISYKQAFEIIFYNGGEGGIRTLAAVAHSNGLANRPLQPLEYFSVHHQFSLIGLKT